MNAIKQVCESMQRTFLSIFFLRSTDSLLGCYKGLSSAKSVPWADQAH